MTCQAVQGVVACDAFNPVITSRAAQRIRSGGTGDDVRVEAAQVVRHEIGLADVVQDRDRLEGSSAARTIAVELQQTVAARLRQASVAVSEGIAPRVAAELPGGNRKPVADITDANAGGKISDGVRRCVANTRPNSETIRVHTPGEGVVAQASRQVVLTGTATEDVIAVVAVKLIIAREAVDFVIARPTIQAIVAACSVVDSHHQVLVIVKI
ncbi:MAG: hypothetical protein AW10_01137 [Candidatus Accumulibacter appositus]|uniref:Uncharacterized protein n=1 Tax=Candidatus Accumulibacter appositus TaxID=1454003 RepID=A0A011PXL5_9PROT|nr:MAG: hypothetical protein AW10_01137 [Candidatus Accumulibacter appositus]